MLYKNVSQQQSSDGKDLTDLSFGASASRGLLSPEPYLEALCEVVVLRRTLLAKYPDVQPSVEDAWQHVPSIVRQRADAGNGLSPNYPGYQSRRRQWPELPYVPVELPAVRAELEQLRANILNEEDRLSRFNRLTHLIGVIASNVKHVVAHDTEVYPPIDIFVEKKADLIGAISKEFSEILAPCIETLGRLVFELSTERMSVADIARGVGIDKSDPRFPGYLSEPVSLEEATSKIRQFFTINDPSSPCHRAAIGALMLLEQLPLIRQRYPFDDPSSPLFGDTVLDDVEEMACVEILESQPEPYGVSGILKLSELIRWHGWCNAGTTLSGTRDLVRHTAELFIHSAPLFRRYGADFIGELYSLWGNNFGELVRKPKRPILTSIDDVSPNSEYHQELKKRLLPAAREFSDALFQDPSFQSMALLTGADSMIPLRAIEMFSDIRGIAQKGQNNLSFSADDLVRTFLGQRVSQFEHALHENMPRYARPISAQDLKTHLAVEHHLSKAFEGRLQIEDPYEEYPRADLVSLALEAGHLVRAGQLRSPSIDLTHAVMRVVFDSWHPERYGGYGPVERHLSIEDQSHTQLCRALHTFFCLRDLSDERVRALSFTPETSLDEQPNYHGVERLCFWLQHSLPGILRKGSHVGSVVDVLVQSGSGIQASVFECLRRHMGERNDPRPMSVADLILAVQMSKYVVALASDIRSAHIITQQPLLPEQRAEIISHVIENPSSARAKASAGLRAVARELGDGASALELFEEFKRNAPLENVTEIGIGVYMLERDLSIRPSGLDLMQVEPGLLPWEERISNARIWEPTPHSSFFTSVDSLGDFDLWVPFVSVKEAFKLERIFAHAMECSSGVPLLREFLHASHRLKVSCRDDPRVEELLALEPDTRGARFRELVKQTRHTLAAIPSRLSVSNPLDAILVSEALGRSPGSNRLPTIDILSLHDSSLRRDAVCSLPEGVTSASTTLPIRRKQRESLRKGSSFIQLFEFCDLVGTELAGLPSAETPEIKALRKSPAAGLLQKLETRHFSIKNHHIGHQSFLVARDNLVYAHHVMEALFDSLHGVSGRVAWGGDPEVKRKISEELNFDRLLQEIDSGFAEYQYLPETKNRRVIEFVPTRGILMDFAGDICGTCVSRLNFIAENASESFFVPFVRGGKAQDSGEIMKRLEGGAFVFRGTLSDGRPTYVIRGFNPSHALMNEVPVGELFERFADCVASWGAIGGVPTVSIPDDAFWGNALTNRRYAFLYLRDMYHTRKPVGLSPSQVSRFNDGPVSHVKVVRG